MHVYILCRLIIINVPLRKKPGSNKDTEPYICDFVKIPLVFADL